MRGFRQTLQTLRHAFLDDLDCDIFISTWDIVGHSHYKQCSPLHNRQPEEPLTLSMIEEVYGPWLKGCVIHPFDPEAIMPEWIKENHQPQLQRRTTSMYFHIHEANKLKLQTGKKYDLTIRCRPDLFFENSISSRLAEEALGQRLQAPYIDKRVFIPAVESFHHFTNDQFMFGATTIMDTVARLYQSLTAPQSFWCVDPAEKTLEHYLSLHKITPTTFQMKYTRGS